MLDKIPFRWPIFNRQSIIDSEELTALELAGRSAAKTNEVVDWANGLQDDIDSREKSVDITNNRKLSPTGNFTGSWFGIQQPVYADPGIAGEVIALKADTAQRAVNVKSAPYNAAGDGATDDYAAFNSAATAVSAAGGGIVYIPAGTYLLGTSLNPPSNVKFVGAGIDITIIKNHSNLGANRLFYIQGTSGAHKSNISFEGLTLRNGTATTGGSVAGMDAIRCQYVDGITVANCKITEIEGSFGAIFKYCTNIRVLNCTFYRCTYTAISVSIECENVWILDNVLDTITTTDSPQSYLFSAGGELLAEGTFFCKKVSVERNVFKNNPNWEAIDFHGGQDIWVRDNYVENCSRPINAGLATTFVSAPVLYNVNIESNTCIQGTGIDDNPAISVTGAADGTLKAQKIRVKNNRIDGFGGVTNAAIGSIYIDTTQDYIIEENEITNYAQQAILLFVSLLDGVVRKNKFIDARGGSVSSIICAIRLGSVGIYGLDIEQNVVAPSSVDAAPEYFMRAELKAISVQIKPDNIIKHVGSGTYDNAAFFPVEAASVPTANLNQKYGDVVYDNSGKMGWMVTGPKVGYGSLVASTIVTANGTSGSNTLTIAADSAGDYRWLPPGMNITIAGAGTAGANLNARIVENNKTTLVLDTDIVTTVAGANVTYQSLTLAQVGYMSAATPSSGSWQQGDFVRNTSPTEQGSAGSMYVLMGWICVSSGSPGTWKECRALTGN